MRVAKPLEYIELSTMGSKPIHGFNVQRYLIQYMEGNRTRGREFLGGWSMTTPDFQ
jgi:hypothetical protein